MATIWKHGEGDWCHICGNRQAVTADIFYPDNAENDKPDANADGKPEKYIRICTSCATLVLIACQQEIEIRTVRVRPTQMKVDRLRKNSEQYALERDIKKAITKPTGPET